MAILVIVEDGSNVPGANSYISVADARLYASNRGVELPVDDDEVAAMLIRATDYLESQACRFQGRPTYEDQPLQWPRTGVVLNCVSFPVDAIPKSLKDAQVQLAMAINDGFDLQPNISAQDYIIKEKVGPIETQYSDPINSGITNKFGAAEALLAPLYGECANGGAAIKTVRV